MEGPKTAWGAAYPAAFSVRAEPCANQPPATKIPAPRYLSRKQQANVTDGTVFLPRCVCVCNAELNKGEHWLCTGSHSLLQSIGDSALGWVSAVLANNLWAHTLHTSREQRCCTGIASQYSKAFANPAGMQDQPMGNARCFQTPGMGYPNWALAKFFHKKNSFQNHSLAPHLHTDASKCLISEMNIQWKFHFKTRNHLEPKVWVLLQSSSESVKYCESIQSPKRTSLHDIWAWIPQPRAVQPWSCPFIKDISFICNLRWSRYCWSSSDLCTNHTCSRDLHKTLQCC